MKKQLFNKTKQFFLTFSFLFFMIQLQAQLLSEEDNFTLNGQGINLALETLYNYEILENAGYVNNRRVTWYIENGIIQDADAEVYSYGSTLSKVYNNQSCNVDIIWQLSSYSHYIFIEIYDGPLDDLFIAYLDAEVEVDSIWYYDSDGDGLGDPEVTLIQSTQPLNYVSNNNDYCPSDPDNNCDDAAIAFNKGFNWISGTSYDINQNVKSKRQVFYNELGKGIQSQSVDFKENSTRTWATETRYDAQGRPALNTLGAPINNTGTIKYKLNFIKASGDNLYFNSYFEDNPEDPTPVGNTSNTLGWYYNSSNTNESYQDVTDYPFSRTIYSELNPGAALKTIGGNKQDGQWKQGYTFSMPAGDELTQSIAFGDPSYKVSDIRKIIKTISRDVHGNEAVIFTDTDGKTLAAARVGSAASRSTTINISEQGFVDIHVPDGTIGFTIQGVSGITTEVYNLITEQKETGSTTALENGFYRVSITNLDSYNPTSPATTVRVVCNENYYDYSLNEYDEAGRLTASYQPLNKLKTEYKYNALGQLTYTKSPDEGEAWFKYRKDGQIRFSQNSKQLDPNADNNTSDQEFSYTNYDDLGRPIESGVAVGTFSSLDPNAETFTFTSKSEQNHTSYDLINDSDWDYLNDLWHDPSGKAIYGSPSFLAGNVAKTHNDNTTTYYSYDVYGRVEWIVQKIPDFGFLPKTIDYTYDPITGAVTKVDFQKNVASERFIHRYTYDTVDNSLIKVETSTNGSAYTTHADYEYYETGALKKVELAKVGGTALQTIDYVYNLNGQLKAINPGGDAKDLFSMQIDYHGDDYLRSVSGISTPNYGEDQFNGNIKGVRWNNKEIENGNANVFKTYSYYYNKNNWLENAIYGDYTDTGGGGTKINIFDDATHENVTKNFNASNSVTWLPGFHAKPNTGNEVTAKIVTGSLSTFQSGEYNVFDITYDANGNIRTLNRNKDGSGNNAMDYLNYTYKPDKPNQLLRVDDAAGEVLAGKDIGDQDADNYQYNSIGQLIKNDAEGIEYVYNASGLVTEIKKNTVPLVKFFYNDKGYRVKKETYTGSSLTRTDYYVRDAAGTALAIYEGTTVKEHPIYGASRLGVFNRTGANSGSSVYQLTDHLGNVRAVAQWNGANAEAIVATDYYPFGMPMPNRNVEGNYRYKFQGQEKDPETGKEAFELRLWDSRIGRWLSPDPYGQFASPYLGMGNNPISMIDPDGGMSGPGDKLGGDNGKSMTEGITLDTVCIGCDASKVTINSQGFDISVSASLFTVPKLANSALSLGIDSYLDDIKYSDLLKTPKNHFAASSNGNTVYWKNNFRGNGSVSGSTVTNAKVDFTKNLRTGSNLTKVRGVTSALGYTLTAVTVTLDTRDYMNGSISGHRYSYHMGVSASATSFGYLFGTGPGVLVGVAGMAVEKGYDVFVDPRGPVWSNYGSWIPTSAGGIMQGFGGR